MFTAEITQADLETKSGLGDGFNWVENYAWKRLLEHHLIGGDLVIHLDLDLFDGSSFS